MLRRYFQVALIASLTLICGAGPVWAQPDNKSYAERQLNRFRNEAVQDYSVDRTIRGILRESQVRGVGGATQSSLPSRNFSDLGVSSPSLGKPFSQVTPAPTVSPYLNLFREDLGGNDDLNYQTLVRPQLEQQRINAQVQRQNTELARRVQSISAQSNFSNPRGAESQYPTGHPTSFRYYSHFYPTMGRR